MGHVLDQRQRQALDGMMPKPKTFHTRAELGPGVGTVTIETLLAMGLIEAGASGQCGQPGWRLTDDGWKCMFGKALADMMPGTGPHFQIKVMRWPPAAVRKPVGP